jgi:hypothetical protein
MTERVIRLDLRIETDREADDADLLTLARQLRGHLLELDIESAEPTSAGLAPPGTRGGELFVAGALTVMLAQSPELFTALIKRVEDWITPHGGRRVEIEINDMKLKVEGLPRKEQRELIQFFQAAVNHHPDR